MSAVLQSPALPTLVNMEELTTYIDSEIQKGIEKALPAAIEKVLSDPENPLFIKAVESVLAISEHKILKRLYTHDIMLGLKEPFDLDDEEREPTIPEQINLLADRIDKLSQNAVIATGKPTEEKAPELPVIPTTSLDLKAEAIVTHLKEEIKPSWSGNVVINNPDFYTFFKEKVADGLRWKPDLRNPRQAKKEILERAVKLYPDLVEIIKNKSGNMITGIALKPSANRRDTYGC
jgi:hypothetical protein